MLDAPHLWSCLLRRQFCFPSKKMKSLLFGEGFFIVDENENLRGPRFSLRTCFKRSIEIAKDEQVSRYGTPSRRRSPKRW
ncbi:hypothetical protein [Klebsiella pneumoniae]|uniref:hypothetical protein n=2 Tax=Klebsiella pneumoniae TaxID=573 RepID=UPI0014643AFD|nr:hypothetical protein [Klebsiella pneumoniae]EMB9072022.1 hypothetical protein [Klebsiella pneumoniae]QJL91494.1 hypothetical protein HJW87_05230 [Klebsiella pneumoniae]HBT3310382.1 hypothetical protein [Klebsiella pneumoniae]